jgi:hypothetical protein
MDINNKVKEIKQSFRQMMDGATAQSMRDKGLNYHLNWGATLPRLREMADEIKQSVDVEDALYDLAIALWKENVRECKILATMLMPPEKMLSEVADIWMEQTPTVEVAEQAAFNLYQRLPYAAEKAFLWISLPDDLPQLCGYHILSRLFMRQQDLNERGINEFIDQALTALSSSSLSVQKAAFAALQHFADLSLMHRRLAESALRSHGFQL